MLKKLDGDCDRANIYSSFDMSISNGAISDKGYYFVFWLLFSLLCLEIANKQLDSDWSNHNAFQCNICQSC